MEILRHLSQNVQLQHHSGYSESTVRAIAKELIELRNHLDSHGVLHAMKKKFAHSKFGKVHQLPVPSPDSW